MMHRRLTAVLAAIALAGCLSPAAVGTAEAAATAPGHARAALPPDPDALAIIHEDADGRRTPLLDPRGMPVYEDLGHGLQPDITVERVGELGYDLVLDFDNTTRRPVGLGRINVGVITLGPDIGWLSQNRRSTFDEINRRDFRVQNRPYPGGFYSPLGVLRNDRFAVGVSLLFDALEDRHSINVRYAAPNGRYANGPGGAGYSIGFELGNPADGGGDVMYPAELLPGETRRYRVAVRAIELNGTSTPNGPQAWLETIEPYREHFTRLYGGVTYSRDDRPVRAHVIAGPTAISDSNPMGFNGGSSRRVDLLGWQPMIADLMQPRGFERTMLWSPGGLYYRNRQLNYPSRFMSQLLTTPKLQTAFDERTGLPSLAATGHEVGLWWGRSSKVMPAWDTPQFAPLDLSEPERVELALSEMRLADRTGATIVGLDAFVIRDMPLWQQYEWIVRLRQQYPHITSVIEPMTCDILHTLAPTFAVVWRNGDRTGQPATRYKVHDPHYLADYLVPGHELWGYFRYQGTTIPQNAVRVQRDAEYIAGTGHVPVMGTRFPLGNPERARAKPTWLLTVPDALKAEAHRTPTPRVYAIPGAGDTTPPGNDDNNDDNNGDNNNGNNGNGTTKNGNGNGNGDGKGKDGEGDGRDRKRDQDDPRLATTRPFLLPNGRVIRLPVYEGN